MTPPRGCEPAVAFHLSAGDLVGYYYEADRVLELIDGWPHTMVRGNHEEMLAEWRSGQKTTS